MEEKARKIAELLKLLSNEQRLLILCALMHGRKKCERDTQAHAEYYRFRAFAASPSLKNCGSPQFGKTGNECELLDQ